MPKKCRDCKQGIPSEARHCHHCGRPALFPNVEQAEAGDQVRALGVRYRAQVSRARREGRLASLRSFERSLKKAAASKALPASEISRLVAKETAIGATYYQQLAGICRLPDENEWDKLRRIADAVFFGSNASDINFAALSINDRWLTNYGDGAIFFRQKMIAHRATLFEENIVLWHKKAPAARTIPKGYSATWRERARLAIAKLGERVDAVARTDDLLLRSGLDTSGDSFIEVHICGTYSARSVALFIVRRAALSKLERQILADKAGAVGYRYVEII